MKWRSSSRVSHYTETDCCRSGSPYWPNAPSSHACMKRTRYCGTSSPSALSSPSCRRSTTSTSRWRPPLRKVSNFNFPRSDSAPRSSISSIPHLQSGPQNDCVWGKNWGRRFLIWPSPTSPKNLWRKVFCSSIGSFTKENNPWLFVRILWSFSRCPEDVEWLLLHYVPSTTLREACFRH